MYEREVRSYQGETHEPLTRDAGITPWPYLVLRDCGAFAQMTDCTPNSETVLHPVTVMTGSNCRGLNAIVRLCGAVIKVGDNKVNADAWD